jgi:hypothetical protein
MTDLLNDEIHSDMDPASTRMFDLAMDRFEEVHAAAVDADRPAWDREGDGYDYQDGAR